MDFWAKTVEPGVRADVPLKPNKWIYLNQAVLEDPNVTGPVTLQMESHGHEVTLGKILTKKDPQCLFDIQYAIRQDFQLSHDGNCSVYFYGYTATIKDSNFNEEYPFVAHDLFIPSDFMGPFPEGCTIFKNLPGTLSEGWNFNEGTGGETSAGHDMKQNLASVSTWYKMAILLNPKMSQLETEKVNALEEIRKMIFEVTRGEASIGYSLMTQLATFLMSQGNAPEEKKKKKRRRSF